MNDLENVIAEMLGFDHVGLSHFASGDLSALMRVSTPDGRHYIAKGGPAPKVEADMLRRIGASGAPAPVVIAANEKVLVIEQVEGRSGFSGAQADLGSRLSQLHKATGSRYGFSQDYAFGKVGISNHENTSWVAFWRDHRLLNNLDFVPVAIGRRLERLSTQLGDILPDTPPPALLHGDLWSGNVMSAGNQVTAFIDPACYYGDGEVDLAMLNLFGSLDDAFYNHYLPLEPGYTERQPVYSLWPALVHLRLFGVGYQSMVEGFLSRCGC